MDGQRENIPEEDDDEDIMVLEDTPAPPPPLAIEGAPNAITIN